MSVFLNNLTERYTKRANPDVATTVSQSLIQLSSGIYTEEERFVFELLQNAVDAFDDITGALDIQLIIEGEYLVFMHNGNVFTERDIEGLCDIGNGNKMNDIKKIGYKGIGFKSVFMRSTSVTVQSGDYCFKFDKSYWNGYWEKNWNENYGVKNKDKVYLMPWQIIPIETSTPININTLGYNVVTYIQMPNTGSIEQKIVKLLLSSQFLLFLKSKDIRMAFIVHGQQKCSIEKSTIDNQVALFSNGHEESRWLIHTNNSVCVPLELQSAINADINTPQKLKSAKTFDLSFAIALDQNEKLKRLEKSDAVIYTYLPTSFKFGMEGFPFLVNANFITDAGRQQLHKDSEWNKLIFSKIPHEFLTWMKEISSSYKNYYEVLPEKSYGQADALEKIYAEEMQKAIATIAFIPRRSTSETKIRVSDAVMDKMGISESISATTLIKHINKNYGRNYIEEELIESTRKGSRILSDYGVFIFDKQKLGEMFEDKNAFDDISFHSRIKLIFFFFEYYQQNKAEQSELILILGKTKFLLDESGEQCAPSALFLPPSYREPNSLEEDAKILHSEIYEAINSDKQVVDWLMMLGVAELSDITFIKNVVCKDGYITTQNAIDVVRFLFKANKKKNIFEEVKSNDLSKLKFLSRYRGELKSASDLYLGTQYKPSVDIEGIYNVGTPNNKLFGDIYISDDYPGNDNIMEWAVFLKKLGVYDSLSMRYINIGVIQEYSILDELRKEFCKQFNRSFNGPYYYEFGSFNIQYAPFILTNPNLIPLNSWRPPSHITFQKMIWSSILAEEYKPQPDFIKGYAGYWSESRRFSDFGRENFIEWAFKNVQEFPASDGELRRPDSLFRNTEDIKSIAGKYLPVIAVDCEIHHSWNKLLPLRDILELDDYLTLLTNISRDKWFVEHIENNKDRICKIYQRLVGIDCLSSSEKKDRIKTWATNNEILSQDNQFVTPSKLSYITLDGFSSKERVYIGNPFNRDRVIELLSLMGVKIITDKSITPHYEGKYEADQLRKILMGKLSPLAIIAAGENPKKEVYKKKKTTLQTLLNNTYFYHCDKINLTYGDENDVIEKHTFGTSNEFYYIGNLRPANVESLLTPLCRYLNLKGKERDLFIVMIENIDGIRQNLEDKGYDVSLLEDEPIEDSGNIQVVLNYHPNEVAQERNLITGFRGEIIVYEKLREMGYEPNCLSISTENEYDYKVKVKDKTYYGKKNYKKYDITFTTESGILVYVEVKATTMSKELQENMPISYNELSMVELCNNNEKERYIIVRVFGVEQDSQDIYFFEGHLLDNNSGRILCSSTFKYEIV